MKASSPTNAWPLWSFRTEAPPITGHALEATLQLARRFDVSAYDAAYLDLALRRGLPLATLDSNLRAGLTRTAVGVC